RTPQLASLLKGGSAQNENDAPAQEVTLNEPYTTEQLQEAWNTYAEQRRRFQAEYQMLTQPYTVDNHVITVNLLSPVHETMLNNIKSEMTAYLRERLKNHNIQVTGTVVEPDDPKKVIYTNREKFEYLVEKNPILKELKDRLGLDTDF